MALETGTYISDLDSANPTATDLKSQGDDHFRLIKRVVKATFPNINAAVRATPTQLNQIADNTYSASACSGNAATATHATSATTLTGGWTSLPAGTRMPFAQAAAPTGWVQDTSDAANNRMLRVVSTAGGGIAGTHSPILNNVVPSHTHTVTTGGMSANASHAHGVSDPGHTHQYVKPGATHQYAQIAGAQYGVASTVGTGSSGTGISIIAANIDHTHSGTTSGGSSATNWEPRYIDMIVCAKS